MAVKITFEQEKKEHSLSSLSFLPNLIPLTSKGKHYVTEFDHEAFNATLS